MFKLKNRKDQIGLALVFTLTCGVCILLAWAGAQLLLSLEEDCAYSKAASDEAHKLGCEDAFIYDGCEEIDMSMCAKPVQESASQAGNAAKADLAKQKAKLGMFGALIGFAFGFIAATLASRYVYRKMLARQESEANVGAIAGANALALSVGSALASRALVPEKARLLNNGVELSSVRSTTQYGTLAPARDP